jgi:hypothetical protein
MNDTIAQEKNAQTQRHLAVMIAARVYVKRLRTAYAQYEEDVNAWYSRGDGRSPKWHVFIEGDDVYQANVGGKGYAYPECIHGASRWTDYDNICGPCEDGLSLHQLAMSYAWQDVHEYMRRTEVLGAAMRANAPHEATEALTTWALDALPTEFRNFTPPTVRNLP